MDSWTSVPAAELSRHAGARATGDLRSVLPGRKGLHNTRDLLGQTYTALHHGALFRCQVEVLGALRVVEVRQAI